MDGLHEGLLWLSRSLARRLGLVLGRKIDSGAYPRGSRYTTIAEYPGQLQTNSYYGL